VLLGRPEAEPERRAAARSGGEPLAHLEQRRDPLALSLIPGPSTTESRWPPAMKTRLPSVPGSSAMTLSAVRGAIVASTVTRTGRFLREA
jgi:hypothetical protein